MVYRMPTPLVEDPSELVWDFSHESYQVNPYLHYKWCRHNSPVHRVELPNGNVVYMLTKYDDIRKAAMDHQTFSANVTDDVGWILFMDPPDHTRIRGTVIKHFSLKEVNAMDDDLRRIIRRSFAYLLRDGKGDAVNFCKQFPVEVVAQLFGIHADHDQLDDWIVCTLKTMAAQFGLPGTEDDRKGHNEFIEFLRSEVKRYIDNPEEAVVGSIISQYAADEDAKVTVEEIADFMNVMFAGGHETTTLTLSGGLGILAQDEALFNRIKNDRELIPNFVEELVRYRPVLQSNGRITTKDVEVRGVTIPKGSIVKLCTGSGNMDEEIFEDPETFNIDRPEPGRHLSFSRGVHTCAGSVLARRELNRAVEYLFETVKSMRLDPNSEPLPHIGGTGNEYGMDAVPVIIEPEDNWEQVWT